MKKFGKLFFVTLTLAIALRIVLLIWAVTYPLDINGDNFRYMDWAQSAHINGFAKTYEKEYVNTIPGVLSIPNNQPPGTIYVLSSSYELYIFIGKVINKVTDTAAGSIHWVNTYLLHIMLRVPNVIADVAIGVLLFLLVAKEAGNKRGVLAASLVWFNPVVLYNSTIWGQMDGITNVFFILALFLAFKKHYIFSIVAFVTSVFIKLSLLPLLPFFLIFLYFHSGKKWKLLLTGIALSIVVVLIATLPMSSNPIMWFINNGAAFTKGEAQNITVAAFNFWWAITCLPNFCPNTLQSSDLFLGIPIEIYAYALFALATIPIIYLQTTKSKLFVQKKYILLAFALVALAVFIFMPRMHDRYLYPFFPLFAAALALSKNPKHYISIFCALTILHFANLLSSWYPTRYPADIYAEINYNLFYRWSISVLTVVTATILYIITFKYFRAKKISNTTR